MSGPRRVAVVGVLLLVAAPGLTSQIANPRFAQAIVIAIAGRVDWHPVTGRIAFDKAGSDGFYDLYTMLPNGTALACLTCDKPFAPAHAGNPSWHPSGSYLALQSVNTSLPFLPDEKAVISYRLTSPGWGTNNDLWLITATGSRAWRLRSVSAGLGTLHPQFSRSGDRLIWSEKLEYTTGIDEGWTMKIADLVWEADAPRLANIADLAPLGTDVFYETHGFSGDDARILFTAGRLSTSSTDIYELDLRTGALNNLTNSPSEYDEHAHYSPDGREIIWASSRGVTISRDYFIPYTDYWTMDADGRNARRLTYFNDAAYPEYIPGGVVAADVSYGPDRNWVLAKLELPVEHHTFGMIEVLAYLQRRHVAAPAADPAVTPEIAVRAVP